jgi:hypothetical protein
MVKTHSGGEPRLHQSVVRQNSPLSFSGSRKVNSIFFGAQPTPPRYPHNTAKMPKSKRAKVVHLSKTDKKGKELSLKVFANVQEAADNFEHVFVFSIENMRNSYLKEVRQEFGDSRYEKAKVWLLSVSNARADSSSARPK